MPNQAQTKCPCCLKEMSKSEDSCPTCGYQERDLYSRKLEVEGEADRRIHRAKMLQKLFRILRISQLMR
ncbi:hypothetical protein [Rhodopirellula baltica]|uniref:Uncharacterized protein n=3 Tax=Rhodopirellula baltica TaxID=265606 RepID=F2ARJ5_RHOBT|nr:hypothetical protein [Rhodopirellula baltica]EGF27708.1 hypothetical protein RBWH47_01897 [Rhodopirellula baltica WH47]EKK04342.1 hypothetical protein RBSH_00374 [Rhodopirellula baltica SH28]